MLNASLWVENKNAQMSVDDNPSLFEHKMLDLVLLPKKIAHNACSLIVDTNLDRTIYTELSCLRDCDNSRFFVVMRLINLQEEKEIYMPIESVNNWLIPILKQL